MPVYAWHNDSVRHCTAQERLEDTRVVGTTCLQMSSSLLGSLHFDYCIVDEASQVVILYTLLHMFMYNVQKVYVHVHASTYGPLLAQCLLLIVSY